MAEQFGIRSNPNKDIRLPKAVAVKNKQPSDRQITAEQLLREAHTIQIETEFAPPKQTIADPEELEEHRLTKRKEFEDLARRMRWNPKIWLKYALWEEQHKDFRRARSVFERALDVDYRSVQVWLRYAEMEMRNRFINHARNIWDRAVTLLPRVDQLWYKYVHMEEMLGNVPGARQVFERWMKWEPDSQGWASYINFETRHEEIDRAREIYERYIRCHPEVSSYVRYAKFEARHGDFARARKVYERAVEELGEDGRTEELFSNFARFEIVSKEIDRARAIFKWALDNIPKSQAQSLYQEYTQFERQYGDREGIEDVVLSKKRFEYEQEVQRAPLSYDAWFDYIRLEEAGGDPDKIRDVYERAIANVPPASAKHYWQRYIYLWINYALFEELTVGDKDKALEVYSTALQLVPHREFTFAKLWVLTAQLEIRRKNLAGARKLLGRAIGMCPKDKIFERYIEIEYTLGNIDRCRALYEKWIEYRPSNCDAWIKFAELEASLGETDRARSIFELAVHQPLLDMPERLWRAFIEFEAGQGERGRARGLYERLLEKTKHVKVWLGFAEFEAAPLGAEGEGGRGEGEGDEAPGAREQAAREVYSRAYRCLRDEFADKKEETLVVLEAWRAFERTCVGSDEDARGLRVQEVEAKMPRRVKRKRPIIDPRGREQGFEEYWDYVFPEEEKAAPNLKLLEAAYKWKKQKTGDA